MIEETAVSFREVIFRQLLREGPGIGSSKIYQVSPFHTFPQGNVI
jgi:hypothetical protein